MLWVSFNNIKKFIASIHMCLFASKVLDALLCNVCGVSAAAYNWNCLYNDAEVPTRLAEPF